VQLVFVLWKQQLEKPSTKGSEHSISEVTLTKQSMLGWMYTPVMDKACPIHINT